MKVLGYVHTYNDAAVIDGTIQALCQQTYPIPEILLIDNASTDDTLDRAYPSKVTIIRNNQNLGTSGAVKIGMEYALAKGYDWIYILDADSRPESDAVENLVRFYQNLSPELQTRTWWLSSLQKEAQTGHFHHGSIFTSRGTQMLNPPRLPPQYPCHSNMWSGSFYRLYAVKDVGLPDPNYVLDVGDMIYGYEGMIRGYTGFLDQSSLILHNLHPVETLHFSRFISHYVGVFYSPPIRCYYSWRNSFYFWLHRYRNGNSLQIVITHFYRFVKFLIKTLLFLKRPGPILRACVRGMWDGLHARLENRF
jgi:GT2 family glycosyltransferase